jgi:hypothetical protein
MDLSNKQIERQDFVDSATFDFINSLIPNEKQLEWDIDSIAQVRNKVWDVLKHRNICTEQEFYPYIEE